MKAFIEKLRELSLPKLAIILTLVFFLAQATFTILTYTTGDELFFQKAIKLMALIFIPVLLLVRDRKAFLKLILITVIFVVGQWALPEEEFRYITLVGFSRYFFFLSLVFLFTQMNYREKFTGPLLKIFKWLLVFNSILIILAFCFHWKLFLTYGQDRFGYNGIFYASSSSSYFYIIGLMFLLITYSKTWFKKWFTYLIIFAGLLVGTKSIYLAYLLLIGVALFFRIRSKRGKSLVLTGFIVLLGIGGLVFLNSDMFSQIIQEDGLISAVLSYRDQLILNKTLPYVQENWGIVNYLFGGLSNPLLRPQMEFLDLILYFGFLGGLLYFYFFLNYYFDFLLFNRTFICFFLILAAVVFVSGNFFYNASVIIYLIILKYAVMNNRNRVSKFA